MKILRKIISYFKESKDELTKVVWPTRKHVRDVSIVVIILIVVVAALLGSFDFIYSKLLTYLISLRK
jgi:preprotein translocase subunit SecE